MEGQFAHFMKNKSKILAIKDSDDFEGEELITTPPPTPVMPPISNPRNKGQGKLLLVALLEVMIAID